RIARRQLFHDPLHEALVRARQCEQQHLRIGFGEDPLERGIAQIDKLSESNGCVLLCRGSCRNRGREQGGLRLRYWSNRWRSVTSRVEITQLSHERLIAVSELSQHSLPQRIIQRRQDGASSRETLRPPFGFDLRKQLSENLRFEIEQHFRRDLMQP